MHKRLATILKWTGIVILALGIIYAALMVVGNYQLRQAYAALEKAGRPMRPEQVTPRPIPDYDNAALVYQSVVLKLKAARADQYDQLSKSNKTFVARRGALPDKEDLFVRLGELGAEMRFAAFATTNEANYHETKDSSRQAQEAFLQLMRQQIMVDALQELEVGSAKPGCCYIFDYASMYVPSMSLKPPLKGAYSVISDLLGLSKIMDRIARLQAADGDPVAARKSVIAGLQIANALNNSPLMIHLLVRMSQGSLAIGTIQRVCDTATVTTEWVAHVDEILKKWDDPTIMIRMLDGERLLFSEPGFKKPVAEIFDELTFAVAKYYPVNEFARVVLTAVYRPIHTFDHVAFLRLMNAATKLVDQAPATGEATWEKTLQVPRHCILTYGFLPGLSSAQKQCVVMSARIRITRAGLAALLYRQEHGKYPEDLATIHMENLLDPFSGKALIYRADATGFIVYSVGPNMRDDGGANDRRQKLDDIAWKYVAPVSAESGAASL